MFIRFLLICLLIACNYPDSIKSDNSNSDLILIHLRNALKVHWNQEKNDIEEEALFSTIKHNKEKYIGDLLTQLSDTSLSINSICKTTGLHKGDFAFMIINKMYSIPYIDIFNTQFDVYDSCAYPVGLFDYIELNRDSVRSKLSQYFSLK